MPTALTAEAKDVAQEEWRTLRALSGYRWVLAILITSIHFSGLGQEFLGTTHPFLFQTVSVGYLLITVALSVLIAVQKPSAIRQTYLQMGCDIPVILLLIYTSGGISSGQGILLITPVAAASFLVPRQVAILLAAVCSIGLLGLETYLQLDVIPSPPAFTQAGVLGAVLFITALVGHTLASRARDSIKVAAKAELDLAGLARMNEAIIQKLHAGVIVTDQDRNVTLVNSAAQSLVNQKVSSKNRSLDDVAPELSKRLNSWKTGQESTDSLLSMTGRRSVIPYFSNISSSEGANTLIFLEDASRIAERAQQVRLAALGRLSASIAHEIRNPLGAISHAQQLLEESEHISQADKDLLAIIARHTQRINRIVIDVLDVSRKDQVDRQSLNLLETLHSLIDEFTQNRSAPPEFQIQGDNHITTRFDLDQLRQVLFNLFENSARHSHQDDEQSCRIWLRLSTAPTGQPELIIVDNGDGIAPERQQEIFEPFFTTAQQGSGLGLYICRELCEINHSYLRFVEVSSIQNKGLPSWANGAAFTMTFESVEYEESTPITLTNLQQSAPKA